MFKLFGEEDEFPGHESIFVVAKFDPPANWTNNSTTGRALQFHTPLATNEPP